MPHILYIVLLCCGISLPFLRMRLEDVAFPFLFIKIKRPKVPRYLALFLGYALFSTLLHICQNGSPFAAFFEWGVFAYCGLLFLAFQRQYASPKRLWQIGAAIIIAAFACWLIDLLRYIASPESQPFFSMTSEKMSETAMPFLARRFQFLFDNPNMFGHVFALPFLLIALPFCTETPALDKRYLIATFCLVPAVFIPLAFSFSKHAILSFAILCAFLSCQIKLPRKLKYLALLPIVIAGLFLETTVLFTTFPPKSSAPFIDTTPGMYTIHQKAYAKIICSKLNLFGFHPAEARELYPANVDKASAEITLRHYNTEKDIDAFCTFMDPHCEYLNIPFLFGFPPLVLLIAFLVNLCRTSQTPLLATCLITALLFSMLWDDILSKRAIWIMLSLLTIYKKGENNGKSGIADGQRI